MTSRRAITLVAGREVLERVRARSFRITTLIFLVGAMAAVIVPQLIDDDGVTTYDVGVVGQAPPSLEAALQGGAAVIDGRIRVTRQSDRAAAEVAVKDGKLDLALVDGARVLVKDEASDELLLLLNRAVAQARLVDRLATVGVDPAESAALANPPPLAVDSLDPKTEKQKANSGLAFAGVLVTYAMILSYGMVVANGVIEEKSSRVAEVLLGTIRPHQLLAGKVAGVGAVALIQLLVVAIPSCATALILGTLSIPDGTPFTFAGVLVWIVVGYTLYSCVYAAAASTVSRPEEVGNATAPINVLMIVAYFIASGAVSDPDNGVIRILSFLPPLAPLLMPVRAALGDVAPWEVPLALALVVLTTAGLLRLAGRIYSGAILRRGPKLKLREAWRAAES